jgi:hypothetical protein
MRMSAGEIEDGRRRIITLAGAKLLVARIWANRPLTFVRYGQRRIHWISPRLSVAPPLT